MAVVIWAFNAITVIASGIAWRYAIQARRSARRVREIRSGVRR